MVCIRSYTDIISQWKDSNNVMKKMLGTIGAFWGVTGTMLLLGFAVWRLTPIAVDIFQHELSLLHWTILIGNTLFMAYSEGYRGFQKGYSPRVAARCLHISKNPAMLNTLLAPLFVMGYFHTTRKRLIVTYSLTTMIVTFIIFIKYLDQPWRGIVDAGVVVGLVWGIISILYFMVLAFGPAKFSYSPEIANP